MSHESRKPSEQLKKARVRNPFAEPSVADAAASHTTQRHKVPVPSTMPSQPSLSGEGHGKDLVLEVGPGGARPDEEDFMSFAVVCAAELDGTSGPR